MKKFLFAVFMLGLVSGFTFAQQQARSYVGPTQNPKTTKKTAPKAKQTSSAARSTGEVYIGYTGNAAPISSGSSNFAGNDKQVHHGIQTSVTINATRYVGLKGDFSVAYRDQKEAFTVGGPVTTVTRRTSIYNILGGVQIKDNESDSVVQPFGHALVGLGIYRQKLRDCRNPIGTFCGTEFRGHGLAAAFGGGFDVRLASRAGVRFSGDYNPMRIKGETLNNYRFGVGVVFK